MKMDIITREDLEQFKTELFHELRQFFLREKPEEMKWLKSYQVRELLGVSRGTLQNLRQNGSLKATKIGGLMFYSYEDIMKMMKGK
jgi:excisionase family DNA binding protein